MQFTDIKTLTYIGNNVSIDGTDVTIQTALTDCEAVQFHKGRDFCLKEPQMKQVPLSKYQYVLDEYVAAKELIDTQPEFTEEEVLAYQITVAKNGIDSYIHSEVSRYNKENNVDFGSIHNVASYINSPTYTHYSWCVAVWDWSVTVWETARAIQGEIFTGIRPMLTLDELWAELPVFTYTASNKG